MKFDERLKALGIERIIIADDAVENRRAACESFGSELPDINLEVYSSGEHVIERIHSGYKEIGLVLTDREMEAKNVGFDVLEVGWKYHIPTFICSGGYRHRGQPVVKVAPLFFPLPDGMKKSNTFSWRYIVEQILESAEGDVPSLTKSLLRARNAGVKVPDYVAGAMARRPAELYLMLAEQDGVKEK